MKSRNDFRTVKQAVQDTIKEMRAKDLNWKWRADVLKSEIRIWWGYLQYINTQNSHFTIKNGSLEQGNTEDDFIVLHDDKDLYMNGRLVGDKAWQDGSLEECVVSLMRYLQNRVSNTY